MNHDKNRNASYRGFIRIKDSHLAAEPGEGDGHDPKYENRRNGYEGKPDYSSRRLGNKLRETIGLSTSMPSIPGLESFLVSSVSYTGHGNCYLVIVYCADPDLHYEPGAVRELLIGMKGVLRADIARSIRRKSVPDLVFEVLPPGTAP